MKRKAGTGVRGLAGHQSRPGLVSGMLLVLPGLLAQIERGEAHAVDEEPGTEPGQATGLVPVSKGGVPAR